MLPVFDRIKEQNNNCTGAYVQDKKAERRRERHEREKQDGGEIQVELVHRESIRTCTRMIL